MTPMPAAPKVSPEMKLAQSPEATDAQLRELVQSSELRVAEIAFSRLQARQNGMNG